MYPPYSPQKIAVSLDVFADVWQKKAQNLGAPVYAYQFSDLLYRRMILCATLGATVEANKFWIDIL